VREHTHAVNAAVSGLSALPGSAKPFAATRAMTRFLNHPDIPFDALIEPAQDSVRTELASSASPFALVVHDWSMLSFGTHSSKKDRLRRTHHHDLGYELGSALLVDAADGRPLGAMELRLRTGAGLLSTRPGETAQPAGHIDELAGVMAEGRRWRLDKSLVHVVDREADSVGHYREWSAKGHWFLVRGDDDRRALWNGAERQLRQIVPELEGKFEDVLTASGSAETVAISSGTGRIRVAETNVVLHRPAKKNLPGQKTAGGHKRKIAVPGEPLPLRLVVTRVIDAAGEVRAEWCLLTNVPAAGANAATVGRWYAWRWRIETFHKLLKSSGMNAEEWQQETGGAFLRRLCVAVMACLTVWRLQRDDSEAAGVLRRVLVRLSGRQMRHGVESTAPALLAGLEKLLAIDDLMQNESLEEILALARKVLPQLFRSG